MATMENKVVMSMEDICDTGLVLGLGSRCDHPSLIKLRPAPKLNILEPSLTLGLSDDAYKSSMTTATNKETSLSTPQSSTSPHSTTNSSFSSAKPPSTGIKREMVDEEEEEGSTGTRKKLRLTKEQSALLEDKFKEHNTLNPKQKQALAKQLNLLPRQVEVWFQNRRARTKLKQTEVDCEVLKRYCETLSEENKRLYKELEELKSLKVTSPPLYMQLPATTLTVCPSCQRVMPPKPQFMNNAFQRSAAC